MWLSPPSRIAGIPTPYRATVRPADRPPWPTPARRAGPALPERSALSPTIAGDGPPRMVKQPTGSGGEPSSPNCRVSAGGKARQLIFQPSLPGLRCLHAGHVPKRYTPQPLSLFNTFAAFAPVDPVTGRRRMCRPNACAASASSARQAPLARWPLEPGMRFLLCPCGARAPSPDSPEPSEGLHRSGHASLASCKPLSLALIPRRLPTQRETRRALTALQDLLFRA